MIYCLYDRSRNANMEVARYNNTIIVAEMMMFVSATVRWQHISFCKSEPACVFLMD